MAAAIGREREMITPYEQLNRLCGPSSKQVKLVANEKLAFIPQEIVNIIVTYAVPSRRPELTNWHRALSFLHILPDQIQALPRETQQNLQNIYSVRSSLWLIPPGSLKDLMRRIKYHGGPNIDCYSGPKNYLNVQFKHWRWVLSCDEPLPLTFLKDWSEQLQIVQDLDCKIPSLREGITTILFRKICEQQIPPNITEQRDTIYRVDQNSLDKSVVVFEFSDKKGIVIGYMNKIIRFYMLGIAPILRL